MNCSRCLEPGPDPPFPPRCSFSVISPFPLVAFSSELKSRRRRSHGHRHDLLRTTHTPFFDCTAPRTTPPSRPGQTRPGTHTRKQEHTHTPWRTSKLETRSIAAKRDLFALMCPEGQRDQLHPPAHPPSTSTSTSTFNAHDNNGPSLSLLRWLLLQPPARYHAAVEV